MASFPDFAAHGFQVIKELGHNLEGGRFTYLAKRLADNVDVVIKQFQFSKGSGWDGFRAIEREIQSLQGLNHRGIPKYLDKFETDNGYCLVTEYFPADTLAVGRSFTPDQIKQIAVQLLEILVYLQERMPPVIHRDVKPENILVDDNLNVYLIDFGFARVGSGSVAMSSANAGTFGFMAPEQIRNLKLTNASDLYGLGLTLICLIGAIRSTDIGNYIDFSNQLDRSKIDPKLKGCSLTFVKWLDQMVAPDPSKRFADAKTALESLKPLYVVRIPEVEFDKSILKFKAASLGEKLTQTITISNQVPETILQGYLEVLPHPNDPPHTPDAHDWISISHQKIQGNHTQCSITVDTSKLWAESQGNRQLTFKGNAESISLTILVETAPRPVKLPLKRYLLEMLLTVGFIFILVSVNYVSISLRLSPLFSLFLSVNDTIAQIYFSSGLANALVIAIMVMLAIFSSLSSSDWGVGKIGLVVLCAYGFLFVLTFAFWGAGLGVGGVVGTFVGVFAGVFVGAGAKFFLFIKHYDALPKLDKRSAYSGFWLRYWLATLCGIPLSWHIANIFIKVNPEFLKFLKPPTTEQLILSAVAVVVAGAALVYVSLLPILEHRRQLAAYLTQEQKLIKP